MCVYVYVHVYVSINIKVNVSACACLHEYTTPTHTHALDQSHFEQKWYNKVLPYMNTGIHVCIATISATMCSQFHRIRINKPHMHPLMPLPPSTTSPLNPSPPHTHMHVHACVRAHNGDLLIADHGLHGIGIQAHFLSAMIHPVEQQTAQ